MSNEVELIGMITSNYKFSHRTYEENFYTATISIHRTSSDTFDNITLMLSERIIDTSINPVGLYVKVTGQYRSFNNVEKNEYHLKLFVFVQEIIFLLEHEYEHDNYIKLDGFICKPVTFRTTPKGRIIADIILAVNRLYNKSDYIPCICWERNAWYASTLPVGQRISIIGRIQSRSYTKEDKTNRLVNEVSISQLTAVS